jgi:hypothetical protein
MQQISKLVHGMKTSTEFIINKPVMLVPVIDCKKVIDGVLYYFTPEGKQYIASVYDRIFGVKKTKVIAKGYKGLNPNSKCRR